MPCIDLAERFGQTFKIISEEQAGEWPVAERPWLARMACQYGHVGIYGGELLLAFTASRTMGRRLRALPFVLAARGDVEVVIRFHVDQLAGVLEILKPRRRRRVTEAERERLRTVGTPHRFAAGHGTERAETALESTQAGEDMPEPGAA